MLDGGRHGRYLPRYATHTKARPRAARLCLSPLPPSRAAFHAEEEAATVLPRRLSVERLATEASPPRPDGIGCDASFQMMSIARPCRRSDLARSRPWRLVGTTSTQVLQAREARRPMLCPSESRHDQAAMLRHRTGRRAAPGKRL